MEEKTVIETIPLRNIKVKKIYSSFREHVLFVIGIIIIEIAGYCGRLVSLK